MSKEAKLQIPISTKLKSDLESKADEIGLSSVNELARLILTYFINSNLNISFSSLLKDEYYEIADEELEKAIKEGIEEHKQGKTRTLDFSRSIHDQLMGK